MNKLKTYVNPLCLPNMPVLQISNKGKKEENPFAIGRMIAEHLPESHRRFENVFGGMIAYAGENDTRATADPAGLYYKDEWYIYGSNGALWHSKDFTDWDFTQTDYVYEYAPAIVVTQDAEGKDIFYLAGNCTDLFASHSPFGPFESIGAFTWNGQPIYPRNDDVSLFRDDDGLLYLYWGMGPGIYGARLNSETPNILETEPKLLIAFDPEHEYERMGQHNQNWENGFPEGSWMLKIQGTYYLVWATAGTQYDTYCMGAYKSIEGPLSGFYCQNRPITQNVYGLVRGGGHGSVVEGPNGTIWCFYTVNIGLEGDMERRIACDPVAMDQNGDLYVPHFYEEPQYVPGVLSRPQDGNGTGEVNLTARQCCLASSFERGHQPVYAIDENLMTCWEPEHEDLQPSLLVSLLGNYSISSARVIFKESGLDIENGKNKSVFQYKIEVMDKAEGEWKILIDRTDNQEDYIMDYQRAPKPLKGQFVKLTITGWNHEIFPAVVDFTCFGKSVKAGVESV